MATPVKHRSGLIATIIFHGVLFFLLLFLAFRTPLPLPAEQGILVDFGNSNFGSGNYEPRRSDPAPVQPRQSTPQTTQDEALLTQDIEESVVVPPKPEVKPKPKEEPKEQPKTEPKEEPKTAAREEPKPVERTVDQRALYPGRGNDASTATSQGEAGGQGNQGVTTGAPDVHVYGQGGDTGGGTFSLSGRNLQGRLPLPVYSSQEQGKVVVEITVDKDGNVTNAIAGVKGSTTLDRTLLDAALKAAKQAKFTRKPDAPVQKGTITYIFKIQGE
jgi:TonB family protein